MTEEIQVTGEQVDQFYERLDKEAEGSGYHLNPDITFTKELLNGMLVNSKRYGYQACPCRLASGIKEEDLDIICPCDYRDPDLSEFGACYCALYVSQTTKNGKEQVTPVPERRPSPEKRKQLQSPMNTGNISQLLHPIWRCNVCGYLCARDGPPEVCPICKAKKDRFHIFIS